MLSRGGGTSIRRDTFSQRNLAQVFDNSRDLLKGNLGKTFSCYSWWDFFNMDANASLLTIVIHGNLCGSIC